MIKNNGLLASDTGGVVIDLDMPQALISRIEFNTITGNHAGNGIPSGIQCITETVTQITSFWAIHQRLLRRSPISSVRNVHLGPLSLETLRCSRWTTSIFSRVTARPEERLFPTLSLTRVSSVTSTANNARLQRISARTRCTDTGNLGKSAARDRRRRAAGVRSDRPASDVSPALARLRLHRAGCTEPVLDVNRPQVDIAAASVSGH